METKTIKEEAPETPVVKEVSSVTQPRCRKGVKERVKSPDSPEGARVRSSPPLVATPTPAPTTPTTTPTSQPNSPKPPFQNGNTTPPLYSQNGQTSPALSVSLSDSTPLGRPLGKVKRFLSTLVQFGQDISPDTGERVKSLVLNLVGAGLTVEEFHHSLQDVTNFPLRPFVLPFLRAYLPALQRELGVHARLSKQTIAQYIRQHEHSVLDPAYSPSEPGEIFHHTDSHSHPEKRRAESYYENGLEDAVYLPPAPKRPHHSGLLFPLHPLALPPTHLLHPDYHPSTPYPPYHHPHRETEEARRSYGEDEWKNIHVMLNCILSMVEKTKRALTILQQRSSDGGGAEWRRTTPSGGAVAGHPSADDVKRTASEIMAHTIRLTEDRVAEVRRKAEEAVNEVKRQAVAELQRAVAAAETKACELVASERAKVEKLVADARKHAVEEAVTVAADRTESPPTPSQQNSCWNCGRKANETCSGCNVARYCGAFCQHKDWETHHAVCCAKRPPVSAPRTTTTPPATLPAPTK
ncbi:protein CBFA2T1-like [Macrosteles quadrilineatus]|uniref:protein CBFA2T1-like n=1 Tax=Macrosteles quadrilineatus TaxID=74068 RepID=UPI0023E181DA|nr:protein CBFA2T1-like [Macrosteles quadrilineatus]